MSTASRKSLRARLLTSIAVTTLIAGCASSPEPGKSQASVTEISRPNATNWAAEYQKDPANPQVAVRFAKELRAGKQYEDALGVLMHATVEHPQNGAVYGELGKILVEMGDFKEALSFLGTAAQLNEDDWTIYSAAGVAYDQIGSFKDAQRSYEQALIYSVNNPTVLSNLGLSYAMSGNLERAESALRRAMAQRNAPDKVQLNLALVVGLQGRFSEAEEIASRSLPTTVAHQNVAHLRQLLSQPSRWQDMKALDNGISPANANADKDPAPLDAAMTVDSRRVKPADETVVP